MTSVTAPAARAPIGKSSLGNSSLGRVAIGAALERARIDRANMRAVGYGNAAKTGTDQRENASPASASSPDLPPFSPASTLLPAPKPSTASGRCWLTLSGSSGFRVR